MKVPSRTYDRDGRLVEAVDVDVPDAIVNADMLNDRLRAALAVNVAYLAIAAPTAAQQRAQIERLTRQTTALLRLALGEIDTVDGT